MSFINEACIMLYEIFIPDINNIIGEYISKEYDDQKLAYISGDNLFYVPLDNLCELGCIISVKYLESQGLKCTQASISWAVVSGNIKLVQHLEMQGLKCAQYEINLAAKYGHLDIIKYLETQGLKCVQYTIDNATDHGHTEVIKYLESQGLKYYQTAFNWTNKFSER
jgi:hypothetical protein